MAKLSTTDIVCRYDAETRPQGVRFDGDGGPDFDIDEYQNQPNYAISFIHWGMVRGCKES